MKKEKYKKALKKAQTNLSFLQKHIKEEGYKVVIILEGRDASGKGGVVKRITQCLNPNYYRVVAKGKPTETEQKQWYFQRWVREIPEEGEIVIFDRSWYTRAGVESVMGFATKDQVTTFLKDVPNFERTLVRQGVIVIKYWLSITQRTQEYRFHQRLNDPRKRWKLSPMDLSSRERWQDYTKAKNRMFKKTNTSFCPWYIVNSNDKRKARVDIINHICSLFSFKREELLIKKLPDVDIQEPEEEDVWENMRINQ